MSQNKYIDQLTLEDFLKADTFGQIINIYDPVSNTQTPLISDNQEFFTQIYADFTNKSIEISDGSMSCSNNQTIFEWIENELINTPNSLIVFIEGYAGCGKSTFVQYLLKTLLKTYNYNYNYYNYDIGAYYSSNNNFRIKESIRECFFNQLAHFINYDFIVIKKFKELLAQKEINCLDTGAKIFYCFSDTDAFNDAVENFKTEKNESKFRSALHKQICDFSLEQVLVLDFILRISQHICNQSCSNRNIYICYDNLDAIENFDELNSFDNTLVSLRHNIDTYLNNTLSNFKGKIAPHFVVFTTYRKITAKKVELDVYAEREDDHSEYNKYIRHIDASHLYSYKKIISKRKEYFCDRIEKRQYPIKNIGEQLVLAEALSNMDFVSKRYAGLWNNNYRTCSSIMNRILDKNLDIAKFCLELKQQNIDGFDFNNYAYFGASSVFLSLVCKVFNSGGLWDKNHLNLVSLGDHNEKKPVSSLTSFSRLLLIYMSNRKKFNDRYPAVSTKEIFKLFGDLFPKDDICYTLSNMLVRDETDTWRRPIYYHRNAINNKLENTLKMQWNSYINEEICDYTELLICECGQSYTDRLMCDYEFFSNRKSNGNSSLYTICLLSDLEKNIDAVLDSVEQCCKDMSTFRNEYKKQKNISSDMEYLNELIHPRTHQGNPQLHTERIIFSHISYLNKCRLYHIEKATKTETKKEINKMFLEKISQYINFYDSYIFKIDSSREVVVASLKNKIQSASKETNDESIMFQSISM